MKVRFRKCGHKIHRYMTDSVLTILCANAVFDRFFVARNFNNAVFVMQLWSDSRELQSLLNFTVISAQKMLFFHFVVNCCATAWQVGASVPAVSYGRPRHKRFCIIRWFPVSYTQRNTKSAELRVSCHTVMYIDHQMSSHFMVRHHIKNEVVNGNKCHWVIYREHFNLLNVSSLLCMWKQ